MPPLAIIDYSLIVIFFICITGLLLWSAYSSRQQLVAPATLPSLREAPEAYTFLAALFLLFIILTILTQKRREQSNVFG
jgi:hypothetical protein